MTSNTLRHVRLDLNYTLKTWDTGRTDHLGKSILGYRLSDGAAITIFEGEDFACSPLDAIDSDDALRSLLGFLTLRPGDTDSDYFADYNAVQMAFAEGDAEMLGFLYSEDGEGEFVDVEDSDVHETLSILNGDRHNIQTRVEAARDLAQFLADGGAVPDIAENGWTRTPSLSTSTLEMMREEGILDLGAALNVALAYGDLTGLEGLGWKVSR